MPLPLPQPGESKDDFLSRCMANEAMLNEFEDEGQHFAICLNQWKESKEEKKMKYSYFEARELRGEGRTIIGVIPYNSESCDLGGFKEYLSPGCFRKSLENGEKVMSLWSHDDSQPLGSTENGTLVIRDATDGLHFTIMPPDTSYSRDALELVKSGTITGCSFGFHVTSEAWHSQNTLREVKEASLFEISPVSFPAYKGTHVQVRKKTDGGSKVMNYLEACHEKPRIVNEMRALHDKYETGAVFNAEDEEKYQKLERKLDQCNQVIRKERLEVEAIAAERGAVIGLDRRVLDDDIIDRSQGKIRTIQPGELRGFFEPRQNGEKRITLDGMNLRKNGQEIEDVRAYLRGGKMGIPELVRQRFEQRALQADLDTSGGYLLGQQLASQVIMSLENQVFLRRWATIILAQNADSLGAPKLESDPADAEWTAEIATGSEDSDMSFGKRSLTPHPLAKRIKASKTLIRKAPNCEQIIRSRLAYKFAVPEEKCFLGGHGANQPLGLLTSSADGISSSRDTTTSVSGTVKPDEIYDCFYSLKSQYRTNAKWIVGRTFVRNCRKFKTGDGQYLWQPGVTAGQPDMILGKPYVESELMPTFASGNYAAIVGDYSFYWIADALNMQIQVLTELYAETNQNGYIGRKETDGMPVLEEAFQRLKLS